MEEYLYADRSCAVLIGMAADISGELADDDAMLADVRL